MITALRVHNLTLKWWAWLSGATRWGDSRIVWRRRALRPTLCLPPNIQVAHFRKLKTLLYLRFCPWPCADLLSTESPKSYCDTSSGIHNWNLSQPECNKKETSVTHFSSCTIDSKMIATCPLYSKSNSLRKQGLPGSTGTNSWFIWFLPSWRVPRALILRCATLNFAFYA